MFEKDPEPKEPILEPVYLHPVNLTIEDADAQPVIDSDGNQVRDEEGRRVYG